MSRTRAQMIGKADALPDLPETLIGVDEVGRGPLAGPVTAAAVILHPEHPIPGLADSKKLSARARERLTAQIRTEALGWAVVHVGPADIDRLNILQASLWAMQQAVAQLQQPGVPVWVDGHLLPIGLTGPGLAIVDGDARVAAISAASILAKTARDALMKALDRDYPAYGFARHAGYPVPQHLQALRVHGPCPEHRRSFAPVAACL